MRLIPSQKTLIHETPWDNLIIFDACRYDSFEQKHKAHLQFNGELTRVWSENSCTMKWLHDTWTEDYQDVTYISSNMFMRSREGGHRFQFKHPERFGRIIDAYMESFHPDEVDKYALVTKGRKVLHYLAPQRPLYGRIKNYDYEGYLANLEFIMSRMTNLIPKLGGLTVITSDHGELWANDGQNIGHPCNKEHLALREVPWFIIGEKK